MGKFYPSLHFPCPPICGAGALPVILVPCEPEDFLALGGKAVLSESEDYAPSHTGSSVVEHEG